MDELKPLPVPEDRAIAALAGPARLAFGTPIRECPPLADRKATAMVAANALILSVMIFLTASIQKISRESTVMGILVIAAVALLISMAMLGSWHAYRCIVTPIPPMPKSLAHFRDLAAGTREEYLAQMRGLSYEQAIRAMLHYNYSVATQSVAKFARVRKATKCLEWSLPLWMALLLVIAVFGGG